MRRWIFGKAEWGQFQDLSEQELSQVDLNSGIETVNDRVRGAIVGAASQVIPMGTVGRKSNSVPWWTEECRGAVKGRKRAFRMLKRSHNFQHRIQYKQAQAVVRRIIRRAKR